MMKFIGSVVGALAFASVVASAQAPKLEVVGGETYDWGKVKTPTSGHLEATIKLKNTGGGILKLVEVKPGCGCTKTDPDKMVMKADEVSTMGVKLNISPSQAGAITKNITVRWGDSLGLLAKAERAKNGTPIPEGLDTTEHVTYLYLKANITKALLVQPTAYFSFQDLKLGQEAQNTLEIVNSDTKPITLSDWKTDGAIVVDVSGKKTIPAGERLKITARIVPQAPGTITGGVKFKTDHPDHPEMDIRAYGAVTPSQSPVFQPSGSGVK